MCRHVSIWGFWNRVCLYVRTTRKEITQALSLLVLYSSNWHINWNGFTSITARKNYFKKEKVSIEFWLVPKCWNHPIFANISPTVVIDTSMERSSRVLRMEAQIFDVIGLLFHAIHKHSSRSQHISVLTTCTFMFQQVCIIEPSFWNFRQASGMHRRFFEGQHLVRWFSSFFLKPISSFLDPPLFSIASF